MRNILIIAPYNSVNEKEQDAPNSILASLQNISKCNKVSLIVDYSLKEFLEKRSVDFNTNNISIYSINTTEISSKNIFSILPVGLKKALRYRWYKQQLNGPTDRIFLRYYHLLKDLLRLHLYDTIILDNINSVNSVSVIRKYDKNVPIIYNAYSLNTASFKHKNYKKLYKKTKRVITYRKKDWKLLQELNRQTLQGVILPDDTDQVKIFLNDFIQSMPTNTRKWKTSIHFLTFGSKSFEDHLQRICKEAQDSGFFDTITALREIDLPISYRNKYSINEATRGFGYWLWKSHIIKNKLAEIDDGDILVYLDAGCSINVEGRKRFYDYVDLLVNSKFSILSFEMRFLEKAYTKEDLFEYFRLGENEVFKNSRQLTSCPVLVQKSDASVKLVNDWYWICHNNKKLVDDSPSVYPNAAEFIEHRHDQSIFSVLRKLHGTLILPNEYLFKQWKQNLNFPFHIHRYK